MIWVAPPDRGWIRRLGPLLATHRHRLTWSILTAIGAMCLGVTIPLILRSAIDNALDERTRALWPLVALLSAVGLVRSILTFAYRYGLYTTAFRLEFQMRTMLQDHLSRLSFAFFDRVQSGQIISRANSDIRSIQMFFAFAPMMAVQLLSFTLALVIMFRIDVVLTLVALTPMPFIFMAGQRLRNIMFPQSWIVQGRMAEVATVVDENVNGVRVVKSFAAERRQIKALARAAQRLKWANLEMQRGRANHNPIIENLPRLGLAMVLLYGGLKVIDEQLTIGDLVAFNVYIVVLQTPFRFLGMIIMLAQRAKASAGRIFEVLDEAPSVVERPGAFDLVEAEGRIVFENVSFSYGAETIGGATIDDPVRVLHDLSLTIEPGERVAIVGPTGSGKSTIPRLLLRFYDVASGAVQIDGTDIRDVTMSSLRNTIGLVPDEPFLFSASLHDNIAYARPTATRSEVIEAARAARAHDFICALEDGYDTEVGERGYDLSGGQRQRITIARVLLANPPIVVLDDATSAIDVQVEADIHAGLENLLSNRTTIVIAHRLSTIALADRVILIDDGEVVAVGTHRDLLKSEPRYRAVLDSEIEAL